MIDFNELDVLEEKVHGEVLDGLQDPGPRTDAVKDGSGAVAAYTIGGVRLPVSCTPPSVLVPAVPPVRGVPPLVSSQPVLRALRWMMQKAILRQDMFLLGPPGPLLRHVVLRFCELFRRELEYVGLTRDTTEADLKQRREIRDGRVEYVDQAPVRAAVHGRVLVLEGIEKAERNVLPLLNNLLENREMALEDGRFLLAPGRARDLRADDPGAQWVQRLVPVHPDFIVVALGLPGRGTPLDPPLRSRFAACAVEPPRPSECVAALRLALPGAPAPAVERLATTAAALQGLARDAPALRLPMFPEGGLQGAARLLAHFPGLSVQETLGRAYPHDVLLSTAEQRRAVDAVLPQRDPADTPFGLVEVRRGDGGTAALVFAGMPGDVEVACQAGRWLAPAAGAGDGRGEWATVQGPSAPDAEAWAMGSGVSHPDSSEEEDRVHRAAPAPPPRGILARPLAGVRLTASQGRLLSAVLMDHVAGVDSCIVGERGAGKSVVGRAFAEALGYRPRVVFCYRDMPARDLLQRRTTDPAGNTRWHDSPLVEAAVRGDLAVLDGVHRLAPGTLYSTIGPLLADRELVLPDGSRLVAARRWEACGGAAGGAAPAPAARRVHPAFRCIALSEPQGAGAGRGQVWLDDEILTLFHFHAVPPMPAPEQHALVQAVVPADRRVVDGLLAYAEAIRRAAEADANLEPLCLSVRVLLRIATHLRHRPGDVAGALGRAFSACLRFLPVASQEAVDRLLMGAMRDAGVPLRSLRPAHAIPTSESETRHRRDELRRLEQTAIEARFGYGGDLVDRARERMVEDEARQRAARLDQLRERAAAAAQRPTAARDVRVEGGVVVIGDVRCPTRVPAHPELVPSVAFVDIPQHVACLRDLLLDWALGHHLLLVGNQGVGKNRLCDRLLGLLRCEREYVQLHRDTTVQGLTLAPTLRGGAVVWEDSPLVRAARAGRCLVVDEADKAPLEVVCVLKALCEDGELALPDGRTIVRAGDARLAAAAGAAAAAEFLPIAEGFRMIVLANRPGFPFLGNDFYRVCGDVFSCHAVDNPDIESEVVLLRRGPGPDVPRDRLVQLALLFAELRDLVDAGLLAYPYSTRELVRLVAHLQRFPDDPLEVACAGVFAFDVADPQRRGPLLAVLQRHGIAVSPAAEAALLGVAHGDMALRLDPERYAAQGVSSAAAPPPPIAEGGPAHGAWDGEQHIGGNRFAGGSGGTGTAGLGGRWGPYRLDVGQELVMVSEASKSGVDEAVARQAQRMADEAYAKRLEDLRMAPHDAAEYRALRDAVAAQIQEMRVALEGHEARATERQWLRQQTQGELDDGRLVDGITGSPTVYMRRGEPAGAASLGAQAHPKRIAFVMDISGSMYTFNRIDRRLRRLMETGVFIFESFGGFEAKYDYRMVGHSGTGPEAERLVEWGRPPATEKERLAAVQRMEAHAQYSYPGDHTLAATRRAIADIAGLDADQRLVMVVSDADLQRYGIDVREWDGVLRGDPRVQAYVVLISNNVDEAERIRAALAPGRAHICAETASLAVTFKQIFRDSVLRD